MSSESNSKAGHPPPPALNEPTEISNLVDSHGHENHSDEEKRKAKAAGKGPLRFKYRPALDGLRGLAVVGVVLFHADTPGWENGFAGVDVFFVLSGYLITSLIFVEILNSRNFNLMQFYARRSRRLLPASLTALLVSAIAYKLFANPLHVYQNRDSFVAAAFYGANWRLLWASVDYFAPSAPSPVQHYWSLSVEEQFYILWPLCFWLLVRLTGKKRRSKSLVAIVVALMLAGFVRTFSIRGTQPMYAYLGTIERTYQLFAGGVVALMAHHIEFGELNKQLGLGLSWTGLLAPLLLGTDLMIQATNVGLFSTFCTLSLIIGLEIAPESMVATILSSTVLRKLGGWSYSIYLWHWPLVVFGDMLSILPVEPVSRTAILVLHSIGCGALGYRFIEKPFSSIALSKTPLLKTGGDNVFWHRETGPSRQLTCWNCGMVATGIVMTCLVGALCFAVLQVSDEVRIAGEEAAGLASDSGASCQPWPSRANATSWVYLTGDSHAQVWSWGFKPLTREYDFHFQANYKSGCPWFYADRIWGRNFKDRTTPCLGMQEQVTKDLKGGKHDILILGSIGVTRQLTDDKLAVGDAGYFDVIEKGAAKRIEEWRPYVKQIVILGPFLLPEKSPVPCVTANEPSCDQPVRVMKGHNELLAVWRKMEEQFEEVRVVEMWNFFCEDDKCLARVPSSKARAWNDMAHPSKAGIRSRIDKLMWELEDNCVSLTEPEAIC